MGANAVESKTRTLARFGTALREENWDTLRTIAESEVAGSAELLNIAIRGVHIKPLKFLLQECSTSPTGN